MRHSALFALLLPLGCATAQRTTAASLPVAGLTREYRLHVPATLPADGAVPLVFVFHGGGGTARGMERLSGFNAVADREGFLVVYPQGVGRGWNDGRTTEVSQAHRDGVDDLAFFDAMLTAVSRQYRVDAGRVYATGISNGGIFSHTLAARRADKLAAIAPVAGGMAPRVAALFAPASAVSVLIVQGTDDPLVPYAGGDVASQFGRDRGAVIGTDSTIRRWVAANGARVVPDTSALPDRDPSDGCRTTVVRWPQGRDGSEVVLYRVVGGGHAWPDGRQYLPQRVIGRVTHDFGSEAIWAFFRQHRRP